MQSSLIFTSDEVGLETERLRDFLGSVLEPKGLYEIRPVPHLSGGSIWAHPAGFLEHIPALMEWNQRGVNPCFSVNPRKHPGAMKDADSLPGSVVVADFDTAITLDGVHAKLAAAGLPTPTAIISTSPDHWHVYWRLDACLPDLITHKQMQQGLAEVLGTCRSVCSHQQVMRLPGPFCSVEADRTDCPRVQIVECDPKSVYPAALFPSASAVPLHQPVTVEHVPNSSEEQSLSDASRALIDNLILFSGRDRKASIYEAARDMHGRRWELAQAIPVLMAVGRRLGLEPDDIADLPRQVRNVFDTPATPGHAASEVAIIESTAPTAIDADEHLPELEAKPLPPPPQMPSLPELALSHGVVGEFMERVATETEAHPVALAGTLLAALGSVIGRGPHMVVGRTPHYVNIFLAVIGNTGAGRKGTGGDIVADCLRMVDENWATRCQSPNLVSGEGVIDAMRDRVERLMPAKKGSHSACETVVIDPGVEDKRLLITCSELVGAFKAGNRENSTLSQTLREAWDGKSLRTMAKNAARIATDPHLSIVGHATRQELLRVVRDNDIFGGTYNRFLFILSRRERLLPHGGDLDDLGLLPQRLGGVVEFARTVGRMHRSPAANRLWESVYEELTTPTGPELVAAVLSRGEAQALRLSLLMALAAGHGVVEEDDLIAALDFWRYSAASARAIFGSSERGPAARLMNLIAAEPGISRSVLHKRVGWRLSSAEFLSALASLRDQGLAICTSTRTGGRVAEVWRPAAPDSVHGGERGVWGEKPPTATSCCPSLPNSTPFRPRPRRS